MKFCCKYMESNVNDTAAHTRYDASKRFYFIERRVKKVVNAIFYCPWCGTKLPEDLILEYDKIATEACGKNVDFVPKSKIPEEFKSDEWWKKRGL